MWFLKSTWFALLLGASIGLAWGCSLPDPCLPTSSASSRKALAKSPATLSPDDRSRMAIAHPALFRFGGTTRRYDDTTDRVREFVIIEQWSGQAYNGVSLYEEIRADVVPGYPSDADYEQRRNALVELTYDRVDAFSRRAELWRTTATDPVRIGE